jgi:hypothetical protein
VPRRGVRGEVGSVFVMFDGVHGGWQVRICGLLPGVLACRMMHFLLSITLACILYEVYYWVCFNYGIRSFTCGVGSIGSKMRCCL